MSGIFLILQSEKNVLYIFHLSLLSALLREHTALHEITLKVTLQEH